MNEVIVSIKDMTYKRGNRIIFDNISLDLYAGKITAFMGPSGTGKTTLMKLITGQIKANSGEIRVFDQDVNQLSRKQLMALRRKISMLFQTNALFTDVTVGENVAFPLKEVLQLDQQLIDIVVPMKLETVGLRGAADLMTAQLSGGMARRAALARSIAMDPQIMIYDEPFTGQDPITLGVLTKLVKDLNDGLQMSSFIVSHDIAEVSQIADLAVLLSGGKIVAYDKPENLKKSTQPLVAQFMNGKPDGPVPFHYPVEMDYNQVMSQTNKR